MSDFTLKPLPRVLSRPNLLFGGERKLVLLAATGCASIGVPSGSFYAMVLCAVVWMASIFGLRKMAEDDPQMSQVYIRSLKYAAAYPARSRPFRRK